MKRVSRSLAVLICAMLAVALLATPVMADEDKDPPGRVARLKYMSGQVSFQPGGVEDWVGATLNRPLTTADRVWTDKDSKAELHLGSAALRMSSETSLTLTNLSDNTVQVELAQGVLNLHVRKMYPGEVYEIDTPNVAFTLLKPGDYRIEVDPDRDTTDVIVRKGKGEGNGDGRGVEVESGEMARFEHGNTLMHSIQRAPGMDGFDDWCRVRDQREARGYESVRYVSDDVIGYEDLDEYGYWRSVPTYGYIWVPRRVVYGWAPYRYGHWAWVGPWGWTWIDDSPWGFAPFHYGRWVYSSYGWGWCPGPRHYRPVYAPALVAWIGGGGWGVGFGIGNVGWVPLGWGEPYYPYYRASHHYVRNVNITNTHITNITYVTNNYTNIINNHGKPVRMPHGYMNSRAVSVVPNDTLVRSERVDRNVRPWNGKDLRNVEIQHTPGVNPGRESVFGGGREVREPERRHERPVVTKLTPPERPQPFEPRRPYMDKEGKPTGRNTDARGPVVPDARRPVMDNENGKGPRNGNGNRASDRPVAPTVPAERKPVTVGEGPDNRESGKPAVPRPPMDRKPANADDGTPVSRGRSDNPGRVVPRPPAERQRVSNGDSQGGYDTGLQRVPRPPAERDRVTDTDDQRAGRDANKPRVAPQVPQERRPAPSPEDSARTNRGSQPDRVARPDIPDTRRPAEAEARPQSAPRPPEHEVRPPQSPRDAAPREERKSSGPREQAPKPPKPAEKDKPATTAAPAGFMARSGPSSHYVPRPPESLSSSYNRPTSYRSAPSSYRGDAESSYSRRESARNSYSRDSYRPQNARESSPRQYSAREYSYSGREYSGRSEMRSAPSYRGGSGYSGRSYGSGYSQPSHAASGYSGRSGGGSYNRGGGSSSYRGSDRGRAR